MSILRNLLLSKAHLVSQAKLPVPTGTVPAAPMVSGGIGRILQVIRSRMPGKPKTAAPMPVRTVTVVSRPRMVVRGGKVASATYMTRIPRAVMPMFRTILQQKLAQGVPYYMARDSALQEAIARQKSAAQGQ